MPRGNYRKRETKKPKKAVKKAIQAPPIIASSEVEVIKKKRKPRDEEL